MHFGGATPHTKVDMTGWLEQIGGRYVGRVPGWFSKYRWVNFDFGFYNPSTGLWSHANNGVNSEDPMEVITDEWTKRAMMDLTARCIV